MALTTIESLTQEHESRPDSPACLLVHNSRAIPLRSEEPYCLHVYNKDVIVKKESFPVQHEIQKRAEIFQFSDASRRRLLFVCRNMGDFIKSQICLTYHKQSPVDGKAVKKHLNTFLQALRDSSYFPNLHFLWVLEFQANGHPHIHFFSDIPATKEFRMLLAYHWNRITKETEQHLRFTAHEKNMFEWQMKSGKYLAKEYITKSVQKGVPENFKNVGRFWGNSQNMKPEFQVVEPDQLPNLKKYRQVIRVLSKQREKQIEKYKKGKAKLRGRVRSYALPLCSSLFYILANNFNWLEINTGLFSYQAVNGLQSWQVPF